MDLGFNLAQSNRDLKDPTSRQNFGDTSGLLCKNDLIPCLTESHTKSWFDEVVTGLHKGGGLTNQQGRKEGPLMVGGKCGQQLLQCVSNEEVGQEE